MVKPKRFFDEWRLNCDIREKNTKTNSCIHLAFVENVELAELLLENGADANVRYSNSGKTPLYSSIEKGDLLLLVLIKFRRKKSTQTIFFFRQRKTRKFID